MSPPRVARMRAFNRFTAPRFKKKHLVRISVGRYLCDRGCNPLWFCACPGAVLSVFTKEMSDKKKKKKNPPLSFETKQQRKEIYF